MDEAIPFDGVKAILSAPSPRPSGGRFLTVATSAIVGIFYNASALIAALPYRW